MKKFGSNIPIIEFILSIISSWWAIVFLNSPGIFEKFPEQYSAFKELAPVSGWATLFILAASVKIIGIIIEKKWLRKTGLVLSVIVYGLISYCYFISLGWFSIGFGTFFALLIMALWGIREVDDTNG